ncbi:hypothetical protein SAMD00079811_12960 [Scytonema sp. HK-05]|nr:hypothetical protein SAMD00079811_12960 [Scytonema sp. HK-05]
MFRKFFLLVVISLWGAVVLPVPNRADATTPLTLAVIQNLRNLVQLMPQKQPNRPARKSDAMSPGDGLSTGRSALADLRFNDGSLARIGEQAVFRFLPKTRNFKLTTGTVLLLIPPGRGQTRINTPNAAAAIRGSALFVRYDEKTDTTLVGALTNSGIQVSNNDASQNQELQAGQVIVIVKGKFKGLYDFDLRTFYETGDLVKGLDLTLKQGVPSSDPAIASVQAETAAAVAAQSPLTGQDIVKNPSLVNPTTTSPNSPSPNIIRDNSPVSTLLDTGQVISNTAAQSDNTDKKNPNPPQPPVVTPQPPVVTPQPPVVTPQPPVVTPQPPVVTPQPPVVTPPVVTPPVTPPTPANPSPAPVTTPPTSTVTPPTPANPSPAPVTPPPTSTVTPPTPANPPPAPVTPPPTSTVTPPTPANPPPAPVTTPPVTPPTPANPSSAPATNSQPLQPTPVIPST